VTVVNVAELSGVTVSYSNPVWCGWVISVYGVMVSGAALVQFMRIAWSFFSVHGGGLV